MNKGRVKQYLGSALVLGLFGLSMAAYADDAMGQDQLEELRAQLGAVTAQLNDLKSAAGGVNVSVGGFAEWDVFNDSTQSFTEVVGDGKVASPAKGSQAGNNGWTQQSVRNSRLSFLATKTFGDWKAKGYVEADFLGFDPAPSYTGAGSDAKGNVPAGTASEAGFYANPTFRIRHAYLSVEDGGLQIMAGQYWTLFGWNMDSVLATVSVAPVMGTLYERNPQVRAVYTLGSDARLQIGASLERPEERQSQIPNIDEGVRFQLNSWKGRFAYATGGVSNQPLSIGISGTERAYYYFDTPTASGAPVMNEYPSTWGGGAAVDALIPILPSDDSGESFGLVATGEWSAGSGYGDAFPSMGMVSGLLSNPSNSSTVPGYIYSPNLDGGIAGWQGTSFELMQINSWNGQLQLHLPKSWGTFITSGYGQISSPNANQLATSPTGDNTKTYLLDTVYFANIMHDFSPNIRLAFEYDRFGTQYNNQEMDYDNRFQVSTWYRF